MNEKLLVLISRQLEEIRTMIAKQQQGQLQREIGRPNKKYMVMKYCKCYENGTKVDCARTTGISIKTVSKHWNSCTELEEAPTKQETAKYTRYSE